MKTSRHHVFPAGFVVAIIMAGLLLYPSGTCLHAATPVPRILVINSYNTGYDWWEEEMSGFRERLAGAFPRVDLYIEHLDTKKFHTKMHFPAEAGLLEAKYANRKLDVIVAMDNAALEFAIRFRQRMSPGTPLVFCGVNDFVPAMIAGQSGITGVAEDHDFLGTLRLALELHPATRDVVVIHDYTDTGLAIRREVEKMALQYSGIRFRYMEEMPLEETVKNLKAITPDHLVLMLSYTVEKGGRTFTHAEAAGLVSRASPVPVYSVYAAQLGHGVIGGRMMEGQMQGRKAADLAVKIIGGAAPEGLPVITGNLSRPMFDYLILERFGINAARLSADALLVNKPSSTFAINKKAVWTATLFTAFCTVGLVVLALNIRTRQRLEVQLSAQIDRYQESQEELKATEEMLRAQVDDYMQSQDELQATEEMLRVQLEAVEESSRKFRAVFENSPVTVALTTLPEGVFCDVNKAFIDMFGYSREEAIGRTTAQLGVWLNDSDRSSFLKKLRENGYVQNFEVQMRRKNGEGFTVLFSGALLEVCGRSTVLSTVMEITEQVRLQNQLRQSQKMDVVGQLAGGIAHDFNNMLAGIMASADLLKRRLPDDDKNHKLVDNILEATNRSADLTRELLTFSRKDVSVSTPILINDSITSVTSLLERTIDRQIRLDVRLNAGNPLVMGDQSQLQNALLNLGVNARDAMPQGGVLTFATDISELDIAACRSLGVLLVPGRYLGITVSDTGVGMAKDVMEHIFEPFFTTKEIGKGTGLGLAAVYGTVRSHKGELCVQSAEGIGSVFRIFLPIVEDSAVPFLQNEEVVPGYGGILLVDDEEILRDVGRDLLEDLGYTVYLAENGMQALAVFAENRNDISLVILDMIMPIMGGREAFQRLREEAPELKVLFCSGFHQEGTGDELVELGAAGFIRKPYNRVELSRKVAGALQC